MIKYDEHIFDQSIDILMQLLETHITDKKIPVIYIAGNEKWRELYRKEKKVELPFIVLSMDNIEIGDNSYNDYISNKSGVKVGFNSDKNEHYKYHFKPIKINLAVRLVTNNAKDLRRMAVLWLLRKKNLSFDMTNGIQSIGVKVECDNSLQIPEMQFTDDGELQELETIISVNTVAGYIKSIPLTNQVNSSGYIPPSENLPDSVLETSDFSVFRFSSYIEEDS